jgi:hypothetical protein
VSGNRVGQNFSLGSDFDRNEAEKRPGWEQNSPRAPE